MRRRAPAALLATLALAAALAAGWFVLRPTASAVEVLVDAEHVFPAVLALVRSAHEEVLVSVYMLGGSEEAAGSPNGIGRELVDALAERQAAGVRVRVLSTRFTPAADKRVAGTFAPEDVWLHPVYDYAVSKGLPILRPAATAGSIDHTKYLVVDGREAIFGGMNLADAVASNHDLMVRVAGPVVADLEVAFAASWSGAVRAHGPDPRAATDAPLVAGAGWFAREVAVREAVARGADRCDLALFVNTPHEHPVEPALLEVLAALGPGDRLQVAMLLLTADTLVDAVIAAHERGAAVSVTVDPERALYGVDCGAADNAPAVAKLLKAGVPTRFYAVAPGQELHMKVFVATHGGERVWGVGSANWAGSDMAKNSELYGLFRGCPDTAAQVSALLESDFETHAAAPSAEDASCFANKRCRARLRKSCGTRLWTSWLQGRE